MSIQGDANSIKQKLQEDNNIKVKVALFGQPGAGKSSLINNIIGKKVAKAGVETDCTTVEQAYEHGGIILVDLPGYGTGKFPLDSFLEKYSPSNYDLFLCISESKFHEDDTELFRMINNNDKTCIFVRSKSDNIYDDDKSISQLKSEITADLVNQVGACDMIFISNRTKDGIDELESTIYSKLDPAKQERWAKYAKAYTEEFLNKKFEACQSTIICYAGLAAANGINPVPGLNIAVDIGIILKMFNDIKDSYGLDREKDYYARLLPMAGEILNNVFKVSVGAAATDAVIALLKKNASKEVIREIAAFIPLVGSAVAASIGFGICWYAGDYYNDNCRQLAKLVMEKELAQK